MSWEAIFADSHFEPSNYTLPIGDAAAANNNINLAPLQYVTDIQPVGVTYHRLVFPEKKEYVVTALTDDGVDVEELLDQVREAALDDYYALLGLEEKGLAATEQDINKNWKHINLFLHPDKAEPQKKAEAEVRFKQCSKAYATLTTPADRIDYDSHWRFDDAIPSATAGQASAEEFLRVYTPVFERNARFSKNKPIPSIGGVDATEKQLKQFYDFWLSFASWREFPQGDTEKIGSSAARDERRRAEQKNKKGRETLKAAEMKRVRLLAERAQASDPRLKAIKAAKGPGKAAAAAATSPAAAKAAAVVGKPGAKGLPAGLAAKQQANIAAKQAEQEKKVQEKTISDAKSRLRGALLNELSMIEKKPLIEEVVKQLTVDLEACQKINQVLLTRGYNDVQGKNGRGVLEIPAVVNIINAAEGKAPVSEKKEGKEWTAQETQLLAKATEKFPAGTKQRWEKVAEFVNQANAGIENYKRTDKDVIRKLKEQELARQLGGADKLKALKGEPISTPTPPPAATASTQLDGGFDRDVLTWSADEQKLLEGGLASVPKDAQNRWELIASVVSTRSPGQCAERFNYLRYQVQKKKEAAAAAKQQ